MGNKLPDIQNILQRHSESIQSFLSAIQEHYLFHLQDHNSKMNILLGKKVGIFIGVPVLSLFTGTFALPMIDATHLTLLFVEVFIVYSRLIPMNLFAGFVWLLAGNRLCLSRQEK